MENKHVQRKAIKMSQRQDRPTQHFWVGHQTWSIVRKVSRVVTHSGKAGNDLTTDLIYDTASRKWYASMFMLTSAWRTPFAAFISKKAPKEWTISSKHRQKPNWARRDVKPFSRVRFRTSQKETASLQSTKTCCNVTEVLHSRQSTDEGAYILHPYSQTFTGNAPKCNLKKKVFTWGGTSNFLTLTSTSWPGSSLYTLRYNGIKKSKSTGWPTNVLRETILR